MIEKNVVLPFKRYPIVEEVGVYALFEILFFFLFLLGCAAMGAGDSAKRIYVNRFDPADPPDHGRYTPTPPDWSVFGNKTLFICCRGIETVTNPETGNEVGLDFDKWYAPYAESRLGTILWPHQEGMYIENFEDFVRWAKEKGLFVFDFWGYVPGCGPHCAGDGYKIGLSRRNLIFSNQFWEIIGSVWIMGNWTGDIFVCTHRWQHRLRDAVLIST